MRPPKPPRENKQPLALGNAGNDGYAALPLAPPAGEGYGPLQPLPPEGVRPVYGNRPDVGQYRPVYQNAGRALPDDPNYQDLNIGRGERGNDGYQSLPIGEGNQDLPANAGGDGYQNLPVGPPQYDDVGSPLD